MADALPYRLPPSHSPAQLTLRILDMLREKNECDIEELIETCAPYTWNVVFLEVDRLSRTGQVCLHYRKDGAYAVSLPRAA
jgi:hypothetical protein